MKTIISLVVVAILLCVFTAVSANEIVTVYVNGNVVKTDVPAVVINGSTMLPFRAIFNSLGVPDDKIVWDEKSQTIEVKLEGRYIFLGVNVPAAIVNNNMINLNTLPYIENGRTMVPVRFVSESLGANVQWEETTKTVYITK